MKEGFTVKRNQPFEKHILSTQQVLQQIDVSIKQKKEFSLARFGIGEMTYLSGKTHPILIEHFKRYEAYAGITCTADEIRIELIRALHSATVVGLIPSWRIDFWADISGKVLTKLNIRPSRVCCAWIMHDIVRQGLFWSWIKGRKICLVGRRSDEAVLPLQKHGVDVIDFMKLEGYKELDQVYDRLMNVNGWDMVLISAGIPATILAPRIAKTTGKVAIDFGHALDLILEGENFNHSRLVKEWGGQKLDNKETGPKNEPW